MNNKIYFLPLLLLVFVFTSCGEVTEASKFDNWRPRNEAFLDSLQNVYDTKPDHGGLQYFNTLTDPNTKIFYKDITTSEEVGQKPLYTQLVDVFYRGSYIFGETFDQNFSGTNPNPDFESPARYPVKDGVNTTTLVSPILGWTEVLQQMKKGQRWIVYIPWTMGYGTSGSSNGGVLGYTVLIFDMQLQDIIK